MRVCRIRPMPIMWD